MRLLVDCVAFQRDRDPAGSSRHVWSALIPALDARTTIDLVLLDRGDAPRIDRGSTLPFPAWSGRGTAEDSILLQAICEHVGAEVFLSTGCTTPLATPSLVLACGGTVVPVEARERDERDLAFAFARGICVPTVAAKRALLASHPTLPAEAIDVDGGAEWISAARTSDAGMPDDQTSAEWAPAPAGAAAVLVVGEHDDAGLAPYRGAGGPPIFASHPAAAMERLDEVAARRGAVLVFPDDLDAPALLAKAFALDCSGLVVEPCSDEVPASPRAGDRPLPRRRSLETLASCLEGTAARLAEQAAAGRFADFFARWTHLRRLQARVDVG